MEDVDLLLILMTYNMRSFKIEKTDKDYFVITISGVNLGKFERSDIRHIIEQMDDAIGTEIDNY